MNNLPHSPSHRLPADTAQDTPATDLDDALFGPPYIHIAADNTAVAVAHQRPARTSLRPPRAVTTVGTLHPTACGIDVDPGDTEAPAEAGHAFGDALVSWCERLGLPWLRRSSGRPGHLHLIALVPQQLRHELRALCAHLARHHAISATVRATLRLTRAPHRLGYPSSAIDGTLEAEHIPAFSQHRPLSSTRSRHCPPPRAPRTTSRSESEYGDALAWARAGWSTEQAWRAASRPGTKAADIGKRAWQRWFWAAAQTIVDAERGLSEDTAWRHFAQASPAQARYLGSTRWRAERWLPAVDEARTERPRRRQFGPPQPSPPEHDKHHQLNQIAMTQRLLRITASMHLRRSTPTRATVRPSTLYAVLDAIATAIVTRSGSLSVRSWAEKSLLDPKSVRRARDAAEQFGLIHRTHSYRGGPNDCDSWQLTKHLAERLSTLLNQSPTNLYTPHILSVGTANYQRLRRTHVQERESWRSLWKNLQQSNFAHSNKIFTNAIKLNCSEQMICTRHLPEGIPKSRCHKIHPRRTRSYFGTHDSYSIQIRGP